MTYDCLATNSEERRGGYLAALQARGDLLAPLSRAILRILVVLALVPLASLGNDAQAQTNLNASAVEVAQLPTFCWAQAHIPNAEGDDFHIHDCGPAANHYCGALLYVIRAKHAKRRVDALDLVRHADTDLAYTERAIKDYASCNIRDHVVASRAEVNNLLVLYGGKRPVQH
jgi:hypothetical protein